MSFRLAPLAAALFAALPLVPAHADDAAPATSAATDAPAVEGPAADVPAPAAAPAPVDLSAAAPATLVVTSTPLTSPLTVQTDLKQPRQPLPAHDGADYLKTVPGFSVIRKGGADGDPVFRGMVGSRLNLLTDGQAILGGCNSRMDAPTAYIYPEAYDVLTVIKGPQSVQHGPMASAATILFERDSERFAAPGAEVHASATAASFERRDYVLDARVGAPTGYFAVQASDSRSDDYKDGNGVLVHSRYHRYNAGAAIGWTPDDDTLVELSASRSDGEAAYADRAMDGTKFLRDAAAVRIERRAISPLIEAVKVSAYQSDVDHVMDDQELRAPGMMGYANLRRDTYGGRASAVLRVAPGRLLTVGGDVQANTHDARSAMPGMPYSDWRDDARFEQYGWFAEVEQTLAPASRLLGGYRNDRWEATDLRPSIPQMMPMPPMPNPSYNETREETLHSAFARVEHGVADTALMVYAGVGHAERFPDYWELIAKQGVSSVSAFDIRSERTDQADVGAIWKGGDVSAHGSLFANRVGDFILVDYNAKMNGAVRNVEAQSWGGEIGADIRLADHWLLVSSLSHVRGRNLSDDTDLPQLPPLEGRLGLNWDNRVWSAGLLGRFVAAQDRYSTGEGSIVGKDLGRTGGFSVWSLNAGWRATQALQLIAGVDNVFDKAYAESVSRAGGNGMGGAIPGFEQTARVNEPGRVAWLKLSYTLK